MKKLILLFLIITVSSIIILFGCSNAKENKTDNTNIESKKQSENNSTNSSNKTSKSSAVNDTNNSNKTNPQNIASSSIEKDDLSILLKDIKTSAENGKIVNSNFKIGQNIDAIIQKLGNPDSKNYVEDAKGTYFTFKFNNIVFGCNNGNQIFEIRSFNNNLNTININKIEKFFGIPSYKVDTKENERILGYKINNTY